MIDRVAFTASKGLKSKGFVTFKTGLNGSADFKRFNFGFKMLLSIYDFGIQIVYWNDKKINLLHFMINALFKYGHHGKKTSAET